MPENVKEMLPFLIPLIIVQFSVLGYTLVHIFKHDRYKRANRVVWVLVSVLLSATFCLGPILYLTLGKEDA